MGTATRSRLLSSLGKFFVIKASFFVFNFKFNSQVCNKNIELSKSNRNRNRKFTLIAFLSAVTTINWWYIWNLKTSPYFLCLLINHLNFIQVFFFQGSFNTNHSTKASGRTFPFRIISLISGAFPTKKPRILFIKEKINSLIIILENFNQNFLRDEPFSGRSWYVSQFPLFQIELECS